MKKVVIAMSGGVDSSVAAALLKRQGYDVTGITMKIYGGEALPEEGPRHACYGPGEEEDVADARAVAEALDIPFYEFDLRQDYRREVIDYYCSEYLDGRTPNPCYRCNATVKFGALLSQAEGSGLEFDLFATGHYARVDLDESTGWYLLKKAADTSKDQSYFLASLSQEQLARCLFPLGEYTKRQVREMAAEMKLPVSSKPESQDFVAGGYLSFIDSARPGKIVDTENHVLGEHRGIQRFTIGQRKGIGVAAAEPRYVTEIRPEDNAVVIGHREELMQSELTASAVNWLSIDKPDGPIYVKARLRYAHREAKAVATPLEGGQVRIRFEEPQFAITPGQAVVLYQEDIVLAGGIIDKKGE